MKTASDIAGEQIGSNTARPPVRVGRRHAMAAPPCGVLLLWLAWALAAGGATNSRPVLAVVTQDIYLASMGDWAVLDASPSSDPDGDRLYYSWRERPSNPVGGLIPLGSENMPRLQLHLPTPDRYAFDVQVSDGKQTSLNSVTINVFVPGLKGVFTVAGSDMARLPDASIVAYTNLTDALLGNNAVDAAISDSKGRYVLENVSPVSRFEARTYHLGLQRAGFLERRVQTFVTADPGPTGGNSNFDLNRGYLPVLRGYVRDATDTPVGGAYVALMTGTGPGQLVAVNTDDFDGSFAFYGVPFGTWTLQLRAESFQPDVRPVNIGADMQPLELHITPGNDMAALAGTVVLAGTSWPLGDVSIVLGGAAATTSDADGNFIFQDVPCGEYFLTATHADLEPLKLPRVTVQRDTTNRLALAMSLAARGISLDGTVNDGTTGDPVRLATVGALDDGGRPLRSDVTDATGHFSLDELAPGRQTIRVYAPGYEPLTLTTTLVQYAAMTITVARAATWQPRTTHTNAPVAAVMQTVFYLSSLAQSVTFNATPSQGNDPVYLWREAPDNPVLGRLPPNARQRATPLLTFPAPGRYTFELQVSSGGRISDNTVVMNVFAPGLNGNVHASPTDGAVGLSSVEIRAYTAFEDATQFALSGIADLASSSGTAGSEGDFALVGLSTGAYWIVAMPPAGTQYGAYGPVRRRVNYSSAGQPIAINMPRGEYRIDGFVYDAADTNRPLENVRIVVDPGSASETFTTTTDGSGYFRLHDVPAGGQTVLLSAFGRQPRKIDISLSSDRTLQRVFLSPSTNPVLASLSGTVTVRSEAYGGLLLPVSHAEVLVGNGLYRTFTDREGRYTLTGIPPGYYTGMVRKPGYRTTRLTSLGVLDMTAGDVASDVVVRFDGTGPAVRGQVLRESGEPITGATLTLVTKSNATKRSRRELGGSRTATATEVSQSDEAGVFSLRGLPQGTYTVLVQLNDGSGTVVPCEIDVTDDYGTESVLTIPNLFVLAFDRMAPGWAPPGAHALVQGDGVSLDLPIPFEVASVGVSGLASGIYTVSVPVVSGYLAEEDPNTPGQVGNPANTNWGNPRYVTVTEDPIGAGFSFIPYVKPDARVRSRGTGEGIHGATIAFEATSGLLAGTIYTSYPPNAAYAATWSSRPDGRFPTNVFLPLADYSLTLSAPEYNDYRATNVVTGAVAGDEPALGDRLMSPTDSDRDGLPDAWEARYRVGDAEGDADGDGRSNWQEYLCATDPTNRYDVFACQCSTGAYDAITLTWQVAPGREYGVLGRPALLGTGDWPRLAGPWEANTGQATMSWTDTNTAARPACFYRIRANGRD